ncbi:hypothetical protein C672_3622 [[Clostridium] bifermentans ATCC 638]|uniref:Uncharacterized protein n=1 Tax=Paraclostridium bifermentans ATCC 638 = DSM 14991 TaxID=1233171 RepID=T4VGF4_PARBF|nr:hypothetical protein [Paraclostridium bifermentans]EQK39752.1 hypothetical protein C672_3622 [[Clostridium] bifermentans ATCC 638] [Paraclostridium bifermentans ATCC 638 = DSM 14991]RIZ57444.1 hypothetical protein CHH45_16535 [Paraclostridium bifermentans]
MNNNTMSLEEAMDLLASNCPNVFAPIATEMQNLRSDNETASNKIERTENALNELIFNTMNGGL